MKKITTILCVLFASFGVMHAQSYSDLTPGNATVQKSTSVAVISNQLRPTELTTYTDRALFVDDYAGTLINEDFDGGPGPLAILNCGPIVSSAGDGCFAAGELVEGFSITANTGDDVIYIGTGAIPNTQPLLGANNFADKTVLSFDLAGAYAVGFDFFISGESSAEITVYGTDAAILDSFTVNQPTNTETFLGLISDVAIGSIEMNGATETGELLGSLSFGIENLSVKDNALSGFKFYPNPTNAIINLSANKNIESVSLFNLLGQKVLDSKIGATTSYINLEGLVTGTYILQVVVEGNMGTYKITKK